MNETAAYDAELQLRLMCHPNAETLDDSDRLNRMCRVGRIVLDEIERLRADACLMALALRGVTPDANTQTRQEIAETESKIAAAVRRALS